MRFALYAGSFDPYTNGHHAIVKKAAALFDYVDIMIGVNIQKRRMTDAEAMRLAIEAALEADGITNAGCVVYDGLIADYCALHRIGWYVRGLRGDLDYNYEENLARVNQLLNPRLETIYLRSDDPAISSSMVRELLAFGKDVSGFVPASVADVLEACQSR